MAIDGINLFSNKFRIGGLATGLDTDQMVSDLMQVERIPLDKLYQKRQLAEWRRDDYRSVTNLLRGLKDDFFNYLKPSANMLSQSVYKKFTGVSSNSSIVTVTGNSESTTGVHTVSVHSLASAGKAASTGVTDPLEGTAVSNYSLSGKTMKITLDGMTREITLDNYTPGSEIVEKDDTGLQALVDKAFGAGKIDVSFDAGTSKILFTSTGGASRITLANGSVNSALADIGFTSGATNRLNIYASMDSIKTSFASDLTFNTDGKLAFTINGKPFEFDKSETLSGMMNAINADPDAKVHIQYDEATDGFIITAKQLGAGDNIVIDAATQEGSFFGAGGASGINTGSAATTQGTDAQVKIDGQMLLRSSNNFTFNGLTYNLVKAHTDPATQSETVSLSLDVDSIYEGIENFVEKYNEVITTINSKLSQEYDRDYQPLTDAQKEDMSEEDIEKWETKAKTGLLRNDSLLQNVVYSMRKALSEGVEGVSLQLSSIGITTGTYSEKGKLTIDETKLRNAIQQNPDAVANLFSKAPDTLSNVGLSAQERTERYENEGLAYRIYDVLEDNIRTIRDSSGKKGLLLEKAGVEGDLSEYSNTLFREISNYGVSIEKLVDKLEDREEHYYMKYTAMEKYISQMNAQSSWLTSQFSSGS